MAEKTDIPLTKDQMILLSDKDELFDLLNNFITTISKEKKISVIDPLGSLKKVRGKLFITDSDKMKIIKKIRKESAKWVEKDKRTIKKEFIPKWAWSQNWTEKIKEIDKK